MSGDAVACPGCGRAYARERFAEGRTIRCACGSRVGVRRETKIGRDAHPRFAADCMLGGLARQLRALGYDVTWRARVEDRTLVGDALVQRRVVLTRDAGLLDEWMLDNLLLIRGDDPLAQVREVAAAYPLNDAGLFTCCTRCNEPLAAAPPEVVEARVPPALRAAQNDFHQCPCCRRVYWEGTHTARMRRELRGAIEAPDASPGPSLDGRSTPP